MSYYLLNKQVLFNSLNGQLAFLDSTHVEQLRSNEWKMLNLFVSRLGEDLSSDTILDIVWEGKRARSSVATSIKNLRAQLRDSSNNPSYIQTQVMTGYAFIASVEEFSQAEYEQHLSLRRSAIFKVSQWVADNKKRTGLCAINLVSITTIVYCWYMLIDNGFLRNLVEIHNHNTYVPMLIEGNFTGQANNQDVCHSLLLSAQQTASLSVTPTADSEPLPPYPRLIWADSNKEVLLCQLSPIDL